MHRLGTLSVKITLCCTTSYPLRAHTVIAHNKREWIAVPDSLHARLTRLVSATRSRATTHAGVHTHSHVQQRNPKPANQCSFSDTRACARVSPKPGGPTKRLFECICLVRAQTTKTLHNQATFCGSQSVAVPFRSGKNGTVQLCMLCAPMIRSYYRSELGYARVRRLIGSTLPGTACQHPACRM